MRMRRAIENRLYDIERWREARLTRAVERGDVDQVRRAVAHFENVSNKANIIALGAVTTYSDFD